MINLELTPDEQHLLKAYFQTSPITPIRLKAQAILMRSRGMKLAEIAPLLFRSERTLTRWFKDFEQQRMASLFQKLNHNQNASKLTRHQKQEIQAVLRLPPQAQGLPKPFWDVPQLKDYVQAEFGIVYESDQSYHYLLKFSGLCFKYPSRQSPRRDEGLIAERIQHLQAELAPLLADPNWVVLAADESRLQLEAEIRRAWLVKGKASVVKTERSSQHQNYLGFLDQKTGKCQVYAIDQGKQSAVIHVLQELLEQYPEQKVCVVWDNAGWHKGKDLRAKLGKGSALERLHLLNFPPYAPEHNPIEHVWQDAKNQIANRSGQSFAEIQAVFLQHIAQRTFAYRI